MVPVVRSVFPKDNKYHPQFCLDERLYQLQMLEYDTIDVFEGIAVNKTDPTGECVSCHYWYFIEINVRFQPEVYGCHDLIQKAMIFRNYEFQFAKSYKFRFGQMVECSFTN